MNFFLKIAKPYEMIVIIITKASANILNNNIIFLLIQGIKKEQLYSHSVFNKDIHLFTLS